MVCCAKCNMLSAIEWLTRAPRFYLASQIEVEGDPYLCPGINGDAHATAYWKLTEQSTPKDDDERSDWPLDDDWNVWFVSDGTLIPAHRSTL